MHQQIKNVLMRGWQQLATVVALACVVAALPLAAAWALDVAVQLGFSTSPIARFCGDAAVVFLLWQGYGHVCRVVRGLAWAEALSMASQPNHPEPEPEPEKPTRGRSPRRSFSHLPSCIKPTESSWAHVHQKLVHHPAFARALLWLVFIRWPVIIVAALARRASGGSWAAPVTAEDVFKQITGTSLVMLITLCSDDPNTLVFTVPTTLVTVHSAFSQGSGGLRVVLDLKNRRAVGATLRSHDLSHDYRLVSAHLVHVITTWVHPQLHVSAEKSVRAIAAAGIEMLEPSTRFTFSLHEGLLCGPWSPVASDGSPLGCGFFGPDFFIASSEMPLKHTLHAKLRVLPYYDFMWRAHDIVSSAVRRHDLQINPVPLTNNLVLHSADHYGAPHVFSADATPMGETGSFVEHLWSSLWIDFWTPVETAWNPVENEYLALMHDGPAIYTEIYDELVTVNPEIAEHILTSCSF
jgi:hypothetical protein